MRAAVGAGLVDGSYQVIATLDQRQSARIPPFEEIPLDMGYILAGAPSAS